MPIEYTPVVYEDATSLEQPQGQVKTCSRCHSALESSTFIFRPAAEAIVCWSCKEAVLAQRNSLISPDPSNLCLNIDQYLLANVTEASLHSSNTRRERLQEPPHEVLVPPVESPSVSKPEFNPPTLYPSRETPYTPSPLVSPLPSNNATTPPQETPRLQPPPTYSSHSPMTDITRLRIRPTAHHCLYPGASFQGTQKSGRNSYDVNVTIVDVDFNSSFLCGYLRIRGLTDDWPELTTYFDAEIIGSRYGFLTQNWGASEKDDMVHWSRFPAFKHVRNELKRPFLTMPDRDRGAVFMRWKERFLVPDHRVQDINGASFAGFYYVCVDFNPPASGRSLSVHEDSDEDSPQTTADVPPLKSEPPRRRRDSSTRRSRSSPSAAFRSTPPVAVMNGFYFHQHSEPYQQLSLCHVPDKTSTSFEFR